MVCIFNCNESESNSSLNHFQNVFVPRYKDFEEDISEIYIGNHVYQKHIVIEEIDVVMRIAQAEWYHMQSIMLNENLLPHSEMIYSRKLINDAFLTILESLQLCDCFEQKQRYIVLLSKAVESFSNSVVPLIKFSDESLVKISTSALKDSKCPIYQYFHMFLDIRYHLLMLDYVCGVSEEKVEHKITLMMKDLIAVSRNNYRRLQRMSFLCNCIQKFWLILQLFSEKVCSDSTWFWKMFNKVVENEDPIFTLWLLKIIAEIQSLNTLLVDEGNKSDRIVPNYALLESKLKDLLSNAGSDTYLECFKIIEPLLSHLWLKKARIEAFQIIWDHYSKRLNISNKKPLQKAIEFNDNITTVLTTPKDCKEDFEMFVGMLLVHLREYPLHWGKIKGRIYSQLGPNKVKDLNETGVTHVMVLFLCLASINFGELSKKFLSFLESLPIEKKNTPHIWNVHTVFIIRHVVDGQDLAVAAPLMCRMLLDAVNDQKQFRLIKEFIENFEHIINYSANYQLHQWLLLGPWLTKYLSLCYYPDLKTALNVLLSTLDKISNADSWTLWEPTFKDCVYPSLKQILHNSTTPDVVGKIGGKLCRLIPTISNDAFCFFNGDTVPPKVCGQFFGEVLSDFPNSFILTASQESMVLQSWVKICLLTTDSYEDLTVNVMKLDCFPATLRSHVTTSRDPIYAFIEYLGSDIKRHVHSNSIIKLCETSFGSTDKWLGQYLSQPDDESMVFRVYTCISLAFLHCGALLYDRNKSMSPLTKLVQVLLLPTDFLIGKKVPHAFVLSAVKKTWHIFFEAIVRLNTDLDTFLERTLRDLILKYVQYFSTSDSPIIKCLEEDSTAPIILEKISNHYFKHPVKESDANTLKVLKILSDVVHSTTSLPLLRLVINKCLYGLFEVVIFHAQRNVALSVIKVLTMSPLYPQVRGDFKKSVVALTEKHLAFNTNNYFQLMLILARFTPADVKDLLGNIKQHVSNVERMRGVGFDKKLREQFEKLESALEVTK